MSKILLIATNTNTDPYKVFPLGMAVIARALEENGHTVMQFDYLASGESLSKLEESLQDFVPDYTGVSIRNMDDDTDSATSSQDCEKFALAKKCVRIIKEKTSRPVIVGGAGFSIMPETILNYLQADYGIIGEGESGFVDLIEKLNAGNPVPNKIIKGETPLTSPDISGGRYDKAIGDFYINDSGIMNLQTKRGCPFTCDYCTYPLIEGKKFRYREVDAVIDDIEKLQTDFGCDSLFFTDSILNDPKGGFRKLAEGMIKRSVKVKWSAYFTPYKLSEEDIVLCKQAGLYAIELGADAACDSTLKAMNKNFSWSTVVKANEICAKHKIACANFVMFGGPGETDDTLAEGLENCTQLKESIVFGFAGIRIYPGTGIHKRAIREGLVTEGTSLLEPVYYFSPEIDPDQIEKIIETAWTGHRNLMYPPAKSKVMLDLLKQSFNIKGLMWDQMLTFATKKRTTRRRIKK